MINLILTIIILILVIYMIIVTERFQQEPAGNLDHKQCNYLPWGPDLKSCVNYCTKPDKTVADLFGSCNTQTCVDTCNQCEDVDRCQWINPFVQDVTYNDNKVFPTIILKEVTVDNPSIYGSEVTDGEVNIEWYETAPSKNNSNSFMIHYVEGTQMNNNVKIIYTDLNFVKFILDEDKINPILKNNTTYVFKVYGLNTDGYEESNILTITT